MLLFKNGICISGDGNSIETVQNNSTWVPYQDVHHFYLGFCAGVLCVTRASLSYVLISDVHIEILSLNFTYILLLWCKYLVLSMDLAEFLGLQVISLTHELLDTARQSENSGLDILTSLDASPSLRNARHASPSDNVSILKNVFTNCHFKFSD